MTYDGTAALSPDEARHSVPVARDEGRQRDDVIRASRLDQFWAIVWKDLRAELRARQVWMSMGLFALLALVVFNFAFDLRVENQGERSGQARSGSRSSSPACSAWGAPSASNRTTARWTACCSARWTARSSTSRSCIGNVVFILSRCEIGGDAHLRGDLRCAGADAGHRRLSSLLGTLGVAAVGTLFAAVSAQTRARVRC